MVDGGGLAVATLALSSTVGAFFTFLPKLGDVRKASVKHDVDIVGDVRVGELAAGTLAIGVGAIGGAVVKSSYPVLVAIAMTAILICVYESVLRSDRAMEPVKREAVVR